MVRGAQIYYFRQQVAKLLSLCITNSSLSFKVVLIFQAAIANYHKLSGLNNRNISSHISGSEKCKIKASAGCSLLRLFFSLLSRRENPFQACLLASAGLLGSVLLRGLQTHFPDLCFHFHRAFPCVHLSSDGPFF